MLVGDAHFCSSVMRDLNLPKFNDCKSQHTLQFLEELDSYCQVKDIHSEMNIPNASKTITDE